MSDNLQDGKQNAILCDMCPEEDKNTAFKTCMKCEISMCVQHLQPHLTTPVLLLSHPLTGPMARGEEGLSGTKCPIHGKLLEYYCLDDLTGVCVSCAIEDQHRLHNMKTLSKAHAELMETLKVEQQSFTTIEGQSVMLESWEESKRQELGSSSVGLIEAVSKLRDVALNSVRCSVSARMVAIRTGRSSIQAATAEKDTFCFLQRFSHVNQDVEKAKAVYLRTGLERGDERDQLVKELQDAGGKMMEQAAQLWGSLLTFVDPENHQALSKSPKVTFDPLVLGNGMSLSEDHTAVFYSKWSGQIHPHTLVIKSVESLLLTRWRISLSERYDWTIGLCDKQSANSLKDGYVYALCIQGNQLSCLTTVCNQSSSEGVEENPKKTTVSSQVVTGEKMDRPEEVEVCWEPLASSLTFFSRGSLHCQRRQIVSIAMSSPRRDLTPFVKVQHQAQGEQVYKPTPQTTFAFGVPTMNQLQQKWRCPSCRKMYTQQNAEYYSGGVPVSCCSCGRFVGPTHGPTLITEVLCELMK